MITREFSHFKRAAKAKINLACKEGEAEKRDTSVTQVRYG